jgi:hypothetical protein
VHAEDRGIITAGQRGLDSGAIRHIHFQTHEVLCRHLYKSVNALVTAFLTSQAPTASPTAPPAASPALTARP